ncbi:S-adenosyl-L-methionine-dependent methyltransferase [Aspergillus navahoensis]
MSSTSQPPSNGRLTSHSESVHPTPSHPRAWSDLWYLGESSLWDRGVPSPALIGLLESYQDTFLHPFNGTRKRRKRALVQDCGCGYDVLTLALHGFDAYGLEVSATAASNYGETFDRERARNIGIGEMQFVQGGFFADTWIENESLVFLCALHPAQRTRWAEGMAELLRPGCMLVCLEFPMYKDPALPEPPWGVNGVHWDLLAGGDAGQGEFTRKVYVQPERTF